MVKVSIVEDENAAAQILKEYLVRYSSDRGTEFDIHTYENGMQFLMNYDMSTDLVFMDIELPNLNGIETSARLREIDSVVGLVYVTNMAKYAIEGYAYHAVHQEAGGKIRWCHGDLRGKRCILPVYLLLQSGCT